ncbi:unnamed protein product [Cuscuta europaea]|uniref:Uncharacterized protein n=1 Tax=Cuscuta europaea TaxID=41803 RepID=A0A9P0YYZ4_CUSEU|nr:unnamed protein product [Cuscuta europaea]
MSLACLVCHSVESPLHSSFRSYSVSSSSDNEGRCSAISSCLTRKTSLPHSYRVTKSKVTPQPTAGQTGSVVTGGTPRLVRSRAVSRDLVRDWNFEGVIVLAER